MGKAKDISEVQDRILGQFQRDAKSENASTNISARAIKDGAKMTQIRKDKQAAIDAQGKFLGNFTADDHAACLVAVKKREQKHAESVVKSAESTNRHSALNDLLDAFPTGFFYNHIIDAEALEEMRGQSIVVVDTPNITITVEIDKALTSTLRCFRTLRYNKPIFTKGPDFETTKQPIKAYRKIEEREKFNPPLGDVLEFRKGLLAPVGELLKRYNVEDTSRQTANIWDFNF